MRKQIKQHEERNVKGKPAEKEPSEAVPAYLLDRANPTSAKALSSQIKSKRAEKAARFSVPIPKVRGISEEELFKVYVVPPGCGGEDGGEGMDDVC
jgi:ribosome biogenesis protein NSA2